MALPSPEAILAAIKTPPKQPSLLAAPKPAAVDFSKITMNQTMGDKTFADYPAPHPSTIPATVKAGLENVAMYDPGGNIVPKKLIQPFLPDTQITKGQPNVIQKIVSALPTHIQKPVEWVLNDIKEGVFGSEQSRESVRSMERAGFPADFGTTLKNEGILPFLGRSDTDKIEHISSELEKIGTDPARASTIAFYDVFGQGNPTDPKIHAAKTRLADMSVSTEEQNALKLAHVGQLVGAGGDLLNVLPFASIEKTALEKAILLAQKTPSRTIESITQVLGKAGVEKSLIEQYAPVFAKSTPDEVKKGIAALTKLQSTTKAVAAAKPFEGFKDLTLGTLEKLKGRATVSKEFISNLTNQPDLKQPERDTIRAALEHEGPTVNVTDFANKVKTDLLPLKRNPIINSKYENISLPDELRGPVADYKEHIYESPIKTSAGDVHFPAYGETSRRAGTDSSSRYFAHSRIEDLPTKTSEIDTSVKGDAFGKYTEKDTVKEPTRRVIELQSDLFQKGRLEDEAFSSKEILANPTYSPEMEASFKTPGARNAIVEQAQKRADELAKLEPYRNTWHERVIKEEVRQAAKDGKTKLQFPTGETAMKIEGLGDTHTWGIGDGSEAFKKLEDPKVGQEVYQYRGGHDDGSGTWIITDVLGDGKFKAVPQYRVLDKEGANGLEKVESLGDKYFSPDAKETFDISGKVDTENPIYKFYEKTVGKYLQNKYGAKLITDPQGVKWWEVPLNKGMAKAPVNAFGVGAGFQQDENGKVKFNPMMAALGVAGFTVARNPNLLKAIAGEKSVVPIRDMLEKAYPKLTETIQGAFAKRLAGLTRESDIQNLLSLMERLSKQADKPGQMVLDKTMPQAVREVLNPRQAQLDIELLTRTFNQTGKEEEKLHAASQNEYDNLWEEVDQKVVDRFNHANVERSILEDVLSSHPGKKFTEFRLPGQAYEDMDLAESLAKGLKTEGKNSTIDQYVEEQGYATLDEAQKGMEDYLRMRNQLKDLENEIKQLKPRVRNAQFVRGILDGVPVVPTKEVAAIDGLVNSATVRDFKDIGNAAGEFRDADRNFERFFGRYYPHMKRLFLDPLDDGKRAMVEGINTMRTALETNVTKKLDIRRGGEEAAAIQDWGERELMNNPATANPKSVYHDEEALVAKFGAEKAQQIQESARWFRGQYDKGIQEANDTLRKIYPNNPAKLIPYRQDYFHHFSDFGDGFMDAIRNFMDVPEGIDPKLAGISEMTKPNEKFKSFAQIRTGPQAKRDAIEGFLRFQESLEYLKNIEPHIGKFRYLRRKIAEVAPQPGATEGTQVMPGVNNFLTFLDKYANDLAGKTAPADRWIQDNIYGGRATIKVLNFVTNRIKANTMLGNMGTTVAQLANIPGVVAEAKQHTAAGMARTIADIFDKNAPAHSSTFLKERFQESYKSQFPLDFAKHPVRRTEEDTAKMLAWILKGGDRIGTEFAWNSYYAKYLAENKNAVTEEAMRYADQKTRRLVAGRGVGEVPIAQKAKLIQAVMPFTLETNNAWRWLGDQARSPAALSTIVTYLLAQWIFNSASEKIRGSRVSWDPLNALIEGSDTLMREAAGGHPLVGAGEFIGRQAGEALSNVGGGQYISGMLPDELFGIKKADIFGQGDPNRYGSPLLFAGAISDPMKWAPPFGGLQVEKTYKGIQALMDEQVKSKSGKTSFPVVRTPANIARATLFGPYATDEAQDSFASGDKLHTELAVQEQENEQKGAQAESEWEKIKAMAATDKAGALAEWNKVKKEDPELYTKLQSISTDDKQGLGANDRLVKRLGVANGNRAGYIAEQINSLKTSEEKKALWKEYTDKKIITPDVAKQIEKLMTAGKTEAPAGGYRVKTPQTNFEQSGDKIDRSEENKTAFQHVAAALAPFGGKKNIWAHKVAKSAQEKFPFTDLARGELTDVKYEPADFKDPGLGGEQTAAKDPVVSDAVREVAGNFFGDIAQMIEKGANPATIKINTNLQGADPKEVQRVVSHEMLHQLFDLSPMGYRGGQNEANATKFGNQWLDDWQKLVQENPEKYHVLAAIDKHLEDSGYDTTDPVSMATERFAYLGQDAMEDQGTDIIPPQLRKYYKNVLNFSGGEKGN